MKGDHIRVQKTHTRIIKRGHGIERPDPPRIQTVRARDPGHVERDPGGAADTAQKLPEDEIDGDEPGEEFNGAVLAAAEFLPLGFGEAVELRVPRYPAHGAVEILRYVAAIGLSAASGWGAMMHAGIGGEVDGGGSAEVRGWSGADALHGEDAAAPGANGLVRLRGWGEARVGAEGDGAVLRCVGIAVLLVCICILAPIWSQFREIAGGPIHFRPASSRGRGAALA